MKISNTTGVLQERFGARKAARLLCEAGFEAIDLSLIEIDDFYSNSYSAICTDLREIADSFGVSFNQAHAPFHREEQYYFENLFPKLPRAFEICANLGIPHIVIHPLKDNKRLFVKSRDEYDEKNLEFYRSIAPLARDYGVKIAIENMFCRHPDDISKIIDGTFSSAEHHVAFFDKLDDRQNFTVLLDVGHVALTDRDPADNIRIIGGERLGGLHIQDVDLHHDLHTVPGLGKIDFESVCHALAEIDYKGDFTLESLKFLLGFSDELIPDALAFSARIASHLRDKIEKYKADLK